MIICVAPIAGPGAPAFALQVHSAALRQERSQRAPLPDRVAAKVYKGQITPHWFQHDTRFWYRNDLRDGSKEFVLVNAEQGTRKRAFDHQMLATALSKATGTKYQALSLPFDSIEFIEQETEIQFDAGGVTWKCDLTSYECSRLGAPLAPSGVPVPCPGQGGGSAELNDSPDQGDEVERSPQAPSGRPPLAEGGSTPSRQSPDGKWTAAVKDGNVFVRTSEGGKDLALTEDGKPGLAYDLLQWSPDSKTLVAFRVEPAAAKDVYLIESAPKGGGRAKLHSRPYALPGDPFPQYELNLFDVAARKHIKPDVDKIDFGRPRLHWSLDSRSFTYEKADRGHQRFRLIQVDAQTGRACNVIDEQSKTFIWTAHTENVRLRTVNYLDQTEEIIYASERDGWRHLYLIDAKKGELKNQITRGQYVVRGIDRIDAEKRQVWFQASGKNPDQDPYFLHHYRVNLDGTDLVVLTAGDGNHTVQFSPDRRFLVDTYSRVDLAPVHELRRTSDGRLVCRLEEADISELKETGWKPPEVFVAKGRDGKTDIWGIICRPRHFEPNKKYPVIEQIYAGPQGSFVPKSFSPLRRFASLTDLGFIVVQMDGMGTANRSKAFHDVCWHNLKDAGFPDRILWHQAVARKYPSYDLSRVGIYGGSAGGQNSTAAVLFHPEFYKVAVSACGCHDNRMDKASWNEQWMGYPVGPQYAECSNIDNAYRLGGKLLLIVGELDTNVPPESTMRLVDALIKAGKDFELLVVPGAGHGIGGAYGNRRLQDFFVRHLLGVEPANRNGASRETISANQTGGTVGEGSRNSSPAVGAPPESFFTRFREKDRGLARSFYKKYLEIKGLPVAASGEVADDALKRTFHIVSHMLAGRPDVLDAMVQHGTRLIIIGKEQVYTDMPEYRNSPNPDYLNERVRGTGGFDVTSFGEENLLNLAIDRYDDESIGVHEFCHTIDAALRRIDPTWRGRLVETYRHAIQNGLWKNAYTGTNPAEYWAEICQSYFDCNRANNWNHAPVATREQLKLYDPEGYELVRTTFKLSAGQDWRYQPLRQQPSVIPPPGRFKINPYYTKFTYAREFIVLGSSRVRDDAMLRANDVIRKMFAYRHDILKAMIAEGVRLVVLGRDEKLGDLPEFQELKNRPNFDQVRYYDYTPELKLLVVPEENVLCLPQEPFAGKSMVVSLFAKALYRVTALRPAIPNFEERPDRQQYELRVKRMDLGFDQRLQKIYDAAMRSSLWKGTAGARDRVEYWVTGVEAYFDAAGNGQPPNLADRPITTREALRAYDPGLFALVDETMAYKEHVDWRFKPTY
jgi:dipeptidyl aminopeptidase/acylaminoacyl peptidase